MNRSMKNQFGCGTALVAVVALCLAAPATGRAQLFKLKERGAEESEKGGAAAAPVVEPPPIAFPSGKAAIPQNLALLNPPAADNPLAAFWNDRQFVMSFAGSYGYRTDIEPPKLHPGNTNYIGGTNELAFYNQRLFPLMEKQPDEAIALLEENVSTNSNAVFDYLLGNQYFQKGSEGYGKAVENYRRAIDKFPSFLRAHKNLAFSYVGLEKFEEAVPSLTRTIELGGADGHVYGILGVCLSRQKNHIGAEGAYRNAMMLMPERKDWKMGLLSCQIEQGKLPTAEAFLNTLLAADPTDAKLWDLQANLHLQMEQPDKAAIDYEVLRKLGKATIPNLMLLGDIYITREAAALALDVYLEAIDKAGVGDIARTLRAADILSNSGAWDEAQTLFKRIRDKHGKNLDEDQDMKLLRLESRVAMAKGEGDRAIGVLEEIARKNPLDGEALLMIGDYYAAPAEEETEDQARTRKAKADNRYEMAAHIDGFEAEALVKRAQLLVRERKYDRALEYLTKAQKIRHRDSIQRYLEAVQRAARKRS